MKEHPFTTLRLFRCALLSSLILHMHSLTGGSRQALIQGTVNLLCPHKQVLTSSRLLQSTPLYNADMKSLRGSFYGGLVLASNPRNDCPDLNRGDVLLF